MWFLEVHLEDTVVLHNDLGNRVHIYIRFHVLALLLLYSGHLVNDLELLQSCDF